MKALIICIGFFLSEIGNAQENSHVESGMSISSEYLSKYATKEGFDKLIVNPMLGEGELETTNGQSRFRAPMTCGSDIPYASITLGLLPLGDLNLAQISVDTNQDGTLDQVLNEMPQISGICTNGYISCNAGTWNNCSHFQWDATTNGRLIANSVSIQDVGSCRCINDGCAPNYSTINFDLLLSELGAGISQALAKRDYSLAVTKVEVDGPTITYYGQTISACGGTNVVAQNYYNNPNEITNAVDATLTTDLLETRIFELARNSASATESIGSVSHQRCTIARETNLDEVTLFDILSIGAGPGDADLVNANIVSLTLGQEGVRFDPRRCELREFETEINVFRPDRITSAVLVNAQYDDHVQVILNNDVVWNGPYGDWFDSRTLPPSGECENSHGSHLNFGVDVTETFRNSPGRVEAKLRILAGGDYGHGFAKFDIGLDTSCKEAPDDVINLCQSYEQSTACRLRDELIDGIATVKDFARTGLTPLSQSIILSSPTCELVSTRDWMNIQRVYECDQNNSFEFGSAAQRVHSIESTTTESSYTDLRATTVGSDAIAVAGDLSVFNEIPVERCTLQCKVRKAVPANDATVFGLTSEQLNENRRSEVIYRGCKQNVCELSVGEELLQDCGCMNGFNDAAIMMQLIRMAGSDMICSSGQKQDPLH
jgi:hypothetical protein